MPTVKCPVCSTKGSPKTTVTAQLTVEHEGRMIPFSSRLRGVHTGCTKKRNKTVVFKKKRNRWEKTVRVCCCK